MKELISPIFPENGNRRSFVRSLASSGLKVAAASSIIGLLSQQARAEYWRGLVGCIKPTTHDISMQDIAKLLPAGIGLLPVYLGFTKGTTEEFKASLAAYEKQVAFLAEQGVDAISAEGAPPFMILGLQGETNLISAWEKKYKTQIFTSSQNQVNAFKALKAKNIFGVTPLPGKNNAIFANYFTSAGFNVVAMEAPQIAFDKVKDFSSEQFYMFVKKAFYDYKSYKDVDTIYVLGSEWSNIDMIEVLEQDLQVTVVNPVAARVWEIQQLLHVRQPISGYGRLLATLPS